MGDLDGRNLLQHTHGLAAATQLGVNLSMDKVHGQVEVPLISSQTRPQFMGPNQKFLIEATATALKVEPAIADQELIMVEIIYIQIFSIAILDLLCWTKKNKK